MDLIPSHGLNFSRVEITKKNFIHEFPINGNNHCSFCSYNGAKKPRYWVAYHYKNGSPGNWLKTFPCWDSLLEYMNPLIKLDCIDIIGYGKVTD